MPRYIAKRALLALTRLIGVVLGMFVLVELSYCVLGGSDHHVWEAASYSSLVPAGMKNQGEEWKSLFLKNSRASFLVLGMSYGTILLVGYGWGILGARLRRIGLTHYLAFPFGLLSCVPGFWLITLIVTFTVFQWNRPGFADEIRITEGFDFLSIWHAAIVAFPVTVGLLAWQLGAVSKVIGEKASEPYVKALYLRGHRSESIFYRNIFRHSLSGLVGVFDKTLSPLLGAMITVEWAYHYPGIGSLLVESARESCYEGIFLPGITMAGIIIAIAFGREIAERFLEKKTA